MCWYSQSENIKSMICCFSLLVSHRESPYWKLIWKVMGTYEWYFVSLWVITKLIGGGDTRTLNIKLPLSNLFEIFAVRGSGYTKTLFSCHHTLVFLAPLCCSRQRATFHYLLFWYIEAVEYFRRLTEYKWLLTLKTFSCNILIKMGDHYM